MEGENYKIVHDEGIVSISGTLRLGGSAEYAPIAQLLQQALADHERIVIDMRKLEFLNSSGIAMFSKFVIEARNQGNKDLSFHGTRMVPWQAKSLGNLQRLMPQLQLEFD